MGVQQLEGRRTGRPKGSRTQAGKRAVLWTVRHLAEPDARPPSPLAERLLAQAQDRPDLLARLLIELERPVIQGDNCQPPASPARKMRMLSFDAAELIGWLTGQRRAGRR